MDCATRSSDGLQAGCNTVSAEEREEEDMTAMVSRFQPIRPFEGVFVGVGLSGHERAGSGRRTRGFMKV